MTQIIKDTTEYLFQWNASSFTYANPKKETLIEFKERKGFTTMQEVIDSFKPLRYLIYFIGTQAEYDALEDYKYFYYDLNGEACQEVWNYAAYLIDGRKGVDPTFEDRVTKPGAVELTKTEYDALKAKNEIANILLAKINELKSNTSPKLAAYIIRCEEYMTQHLDKISGNAMQSFVGTNGKIDTTALKMVIDGNQDKITSMSALCEVYLAWITYIEGGTQADLDKLPSDDYVKVNIVVDDLWKAQHAAERKALIAKLHSSELEFAIVDKYSQVASDEIEVDDEDIAELIQRKKHK